jgi:hypothetical protein
VYSIDLGYECRFHIMFSNAIAHPRQSSPCAQQSFLLRCENKAVHCASFLFAIPVTTRICSALRANAGAMPKKQLHGQFNQGFSVKIDQTSKLKDVEKSKKTKQKKTGLKLREGEWGWRGHQQT